MENTIFFGNGLNLLTESNKSWNRLLDDLKYPIKFENDNLPHTLIYEKILVDKQLSLEMLSEEEVKKKIAIEFSKIANHSIYIELFELKAHNYITTNYDYGFKNSISEQVDLKTFNHSTEDLYSIRRKIQVEAKNGSVTNIWHIHGEIDYPKTIMLGLDHYCGEIGKIDAYIKGAYNFMHDGKEVKISSIEDKLTENKKDRISWIDLFFTSNIYILSFSFDFSEVDLWWILNKRARFKRERKWGSQIRNKIFYFCHDIKTSKEMLFKSLGVEVVIIPLKNGYLENYLKTIKRIKFQMEKAKDLETYDIF